MIFAQGLSVSRQVLRSPRGIRHLGIGFVLVVLAGTGPSVRLAAQEVAYAAPGAVRQLEAGGGDAFPDDPLARSWLLGFLSGLTNTCDEPVGDLPAAHRAAGVLPLQGEMRLGFYLTGSGAPKLFEGVQDGVGYLRARGGGAGACAAARPIATTAWTVV